MILVTGGTGFLGKRLVKKLSKNVIVFSRRPVKGVKFVKGDVRKKLKINQKINLVYHLAANLDENDPNVFSDNVTATKNVVDFCKEKNARIILMSSCGVFGDAKKSEENFNYNPKTNYEKSKAESERIVLRSNIDYTIIRAPVIIGPNKIWREIFEAARKKFPIIGSGKNHFHLVHVNDVVDLLCKIKNKKTKNKIFHIATKDKPTYEKVYYYISKSIGIKMTNKKIPLHLMLFISSVYSFYCKLARKKPSLTLMKSSIERLTRDRIVVTENIHSIGFSPKYSTKRAIEKTAFDLKFFRK